MLGSSIAHRMGTEDERFVDQRKLRNAHILLRNGMRGKERKMERVDSHGLMVQPIMEYSTRTISKEQANTTGQMAESITVSG